MTMLESISKVTDFIGRYSWAVFVTLLFILLIPSDQAEQMGLLALRNEHLGPMWAATLLSALMTIGAIAKYIDQRILGGWLQERRARKKREEQRQEHIETIARRLESLNPEEEMWLLYCLFFNTQTLSAELTNTTAQSLVYKGFVKEGSGHALDLPFHIPDLVWRYLQERKDFLLPESSRNDPQFKKALESFRKSLWSSYVV
jgi:hypothetical protein